MAVANGPLYLPLVISSYTQPSLSGAAFWGAPIAVTPLGDAVWVVNPDAGTVTILDTQTLEKVSEIAVGQEPWSLIVSPDGRFVYITDRATGQLARINSHTHQVEAVLVVGPEPGSVTLDATGRHAYVTLMSADAVAVIDNERLQITAEIPVRPRPYAVATAGDYLMVTHLMALPREGWPVVSNDGRQGWLTIIDTRTNQIVHEIPLNPNEQGFPNLLTGITVAGERLWLPHVRAMPALPMGLTTTIFAAVSSVDLNTLSEDPAAYLPLNDQAVFGSPVNNPVAAIPSPDGQRLYVVLAGSNLVEVIDISQPAEPQLIRFLPAGHNPQGMAIAPNGRYGFVMNYLSRTVTVLDLETLQKTADISVTVETLSSDILRGKILFNNASDPRLSQGSWISCASCHFGGWPDGVTWHFPDGPRQTPQLWNAADTLPWHWSATLDEPQDVEETIEIVQRGVGMAPGVDPPLLGLPNAGRSADLDALAAFLTDGIRTPMIPVGGDDVASGRTLFINHGCAECHGGPYWTSDMLPGPPGTLDPDESGMVEEVLRDVATLNPLDVRGHMGFAPPSLLGVALTAPYLHDGSMLTLPALLAAGHPTPDTGNGMTPDEIEALTAFLRSISRETTPIAQP